VRIWAWTNADHPLK
jgi:WD repeat-containing protein 1 (actin-interacting protein 1)